jgi:hypothetical protein
MSQARESLALCRHVAVSLPHDQAFASSHAKRLEELERTLDALRDELTRRKPNLDGIL